MTSTISARRLLRGSQIIDYPLLTVDNGQITSIQAGEAGAANAVGDSSFPEAMLVPAFVNIHVHGAAGRDVMEGTPEALHTVGASLARNGTGAYYPTTVTSSTEDTLRALDMIAVDIEGERPADSAVPLGIHLEGPFLSEAKRGCASCGLSWLRRRLRCSIASGKRRAGRFAS